MKPKCTIALGWTGPQCGKEAVSMNDYGGFQCEWHDSLPRCASNPIGPFTPISKDDPDAVNKLQADWDKRMLNM